MGPRHEFAEILSKTTDIPADRSMPGPYIGIIIKLQSYKCYKLLHCSHECRFFDNLKRGLSFRTGPDWVLLDYTPE